MAIGSNANPKVVIDDHDGFVITWESDREGVISVRGRAFDFNGIALGGELEVSSSTGTLREPNQTGTPVGSSPAITASGELIVGFAEEDAAVEAGVFIQIFQPRDIVIFSDNFESGDTGKWGAEVN